MQDFEKLGAFYLGRRHDLQSGTTTKENILYDAKDLTTHAVCLGMTGSGKTGLCLSLLEEAALDQVPVIAIDPKGDLGNLMLTFPKLQASDFAPWVDAGQAMRQGQEPADYAASVAKRWKEGLAAWGQSGERIRRLKKGSNVSIYTPGSSAGLPLSIVKSFAAPNAAVLDDEDAFRDKIASAAAGLLSLLGVDADPITSREHILLSNIFDRAWREARSLGLVDTIREIQDPPFERVGVLDLESFFPREERIQLSLRINNLLASPSFAGWLEGEALDVQRLLYTEGGDSRTSILSIAHLSEPERMFFVTLLLNEVLAWMRSQPGTSSLRAILYMDEVFGYFPPTANPPSKKPMLTLLKQARAYGLGIVLATQNPVDLDYKGLSNTGTWFLGRLQTERDKMRVIDGLEGASSGASQHFDRQQMERTLAGLGSRVFLMHNVHDDEPVVFETRWAMSYLRGPMTRQQIKQLMKGVVRADKVEQGKKSKSERITTTAERQTPRTDSESSSNQGTDESHLTVENGLPEVKAQDLVPTEIEQRFLAISPGPVESRRLVYRPRVIGLADLHYKRVTYQIDDWQTKTLLMQPDAIANGVWKGSEVLELPQEHLESQPVDEAEFEHPTTDQRNAKNYADWSRKLKQYVYQFFRLTIWHCKELKVYSKPSESEGDFRARLSQLANERRDLEVEKLRTKFTSKFATVRDRLTRAQRKLADEKQQFQSRSMDSVISIGQTLLGAVLGRKLVSKTNANSAASTARRIRGAADEKGDIARAKEDVAKYEKQLKEMESQFKEQTRQLHDKLDAKNLILKEIVIAPTKSDINVTSVSLLWTPWWVSDAGIAEPAWQLD